MPDPQVGRFLAAVDRLYAAALDPGAWRDFLAAAATIFHADNAYVSQMEHGRSALDYVVLHDLNWDPVSVARYAALMDEDPRMPAFRGNPSQPLHCRMVVSQRQLHASRTYVEALKPLGIEYTLAVGVPEREGVTNYLALTRDRSGEPFTAADCSLLGGMVPHLARAFAIRRGLHRRQVPLAVRPVLEQLPRAVLIVDGRGDIVEMNAAARELLSRRRPLREVANRLFADRDADQDKLDAALSGMGANGSAIARAPQTIALQTDHADTPLTLLVQLLSAGPAKAHGGDLTDRLLMVSVMTPRPGAATERDTIRQIFGLSPMQARLTAQLLTGCSVKEAAAVLRITEGSARQYLKLIFNKTRARRQADLIRIVSDGLSLRS